MYHTVMGMGFDSITLPRMGSLNISKRLGNDDFLTLAFSNIFLCISASYFIEKVVELPE